MSSDELIGGIAAARDVTRRERMTREFGRRPHEARDVVVVHDDGKV